jgi:uncharacterized protein with PQ loop repeat
VCTTLIELMAIGHFYMLCKTPVSNIKQHAPYWISIGFFLYSSVSIVIFSLYKYLLNNYQLELGMYVWSFHNLMNIVGNTCFAIAVWYGVVRHETNLSPVSISQNSN